MLALSTLGDSVLRGKAQPIARALTGAVGGAVAAFLAIASHQFVQTERPFSNPLVYGVPVWGFAVLWIALATALTIRTLRRGMPFALTWWSLTFPVGTFVTGTTQLAVHTGLPSFRVAAAIAYVGLLTTWCLVAVRTFRGGLRGNIFAPPSADPIKAKKDPPAATPAS